MTFPITERQHKLMKKLKDNETQNFTDIAKETGWDRSTLSRTATNHLERKNWAEEHERNRGRIYKLTEKGEQILKSLNEITNL